MIVDDLISFHSIDQLCGFSCFFVDDKVGRRWLWNQIYSLPPSLLFLTLSFPSNSSFSFLLPYLKSPPPLFLSFHILSPLPSPFLIKRPSNILTTTSQPPHPSTTISPKSILEIVECNPYPCSPEVRFSEDSYCIYSNKPKLSASSKK